MTMRSGLLVAALVLVTPGRAAALSCVPTTLLQDVQAAAGVFEATVTARRRLEQPVPPGLPPGVPPPPIIGADTYELALADVEPWRGTSATTLRTSHDHLRPGARYVFVAFARRDGGLGVGGCAGRAFPASRAAGLRSWVASLSRPANGGHVFGAVVVLGNVPGTESDLAVEGARVVVRGPIAVEAVTDARGQFAVTGLPDGRYDVAASPGDERSGLTIARGATVTLLGDHAAANVDLLADVAGTVGGRVIDGSGRPVAKQLLRLTVAPSSGDPERSPYWLATTDAEGRYTATNVRPGRYLLTLGEPYVYAHGETLGGDAEIVVGWAEHVEMRPLVARVADTIRVDGLLTDAAGGPVEGGVYVEAIGPHGPYPMSGSGEDTDRDGRFSLRLLRGIRYRFTVPDSDGLPAVVHDQVADGTPIRLVLPR